MSEPGSTVDNLVSENELFDLNIKELIDFIHSFISASTKLNCLRLYDELRHSPFDFSTENNCC